MGGLSSCSSFFLVATTALFAILVQQNPLLFGRKVAAKGDGSNNSYRIYTHNTVLEQHLEPFRQAMGETEYVAYKNHCLRVLTFAVYHLKDSLTNEREVKLMAMALAYHDVALWSDFKLDYLEPSVIQLEAHVNKQNVEQQDGEADTAESIEWTAGEVSTAREIILRHHKLTEWKEGKSGDAKLVNAVRKGDWADATMGLIRFGLPVSLLERAYEQIPEAGFHRVLMDMGPRLSPDSVAGQLDVLKIFKW